MHSRYGAAQERRVVDDSYLHWVEGGTSMETSAGPERTDIVYAGSGQERRTLPPPRMVRTCL